MQYYVVIGKQGPRVEGVLDELAGHHFSQDGFNSRAEAEYCINILKATTSWLPDDPTTNEPLARYPNPLTHGEELPPMLARSMNNASSSTSTGNLQPAIADSVPPDHAPGNSIQLSSEQRQVLETVKAGGNVFFTGPAGTGKSVLLREIIKSLRTMGKIVAVTASTGIAGVNIKGSTIHSWAGIGLGREPTMKLAKRIAGSTHARLRWKETDVLVIDEISMIDGRLFDKLDMIGRIVRNNILEPFGGIQLVISGDFFQLPPVPDKSNEFQMPSTFAFDSKSWSCSIQKVVLLTHVFRQRDPAFIDILGAMRVGKLSNAHQKALHALQRPIIYSDGIDPCHLFATKQEVQDCNQRKLDELETPSVVYKSMDCRGVDVHGELIDKKQAVALLNDQVALPEVTLKVGAQVMLVANVIQGCLVNGSIGKVIGFKTTHEALREHIKVVEMKQVGDFNRASDDSVPAKRPRVEYEPRFEALNSEQFTRDEKWPLVQFTSGNLLLCSPENFTVEGFLGNVEAKRVQVPLILAWALSMHKSQGQTLERVKVDLRRVFEKGQAYVALSRATTLEQLEIVNFSPTAIFAHPRVIEWQKQWLPTNSSSTTGSASEFPETQDPARQAQHFIQQTPFDDSEMDCEEAIAQYHSHLLTAST